MLLIVLVLSKFSFMGTHPCVNLYAIFPFEPKQCLSLGVEKMLKECVVLIPGDENRTATSIRCAN